MLLRSKKLIKPKQNKLKKVKEENNDNNLADVIKKYLFEIDNTDDVKVKCNKTVKIYKHLYENKNFVWKYNKFRLVLLKKLVNLYHEPNFKYIENNPEFIGTLNIFSCFTKIKITKMNKYLVENMFFKSNYYYTISCSYHPYCCCYGCKEKEFNNTETYDYKFNELCSVREKLHRRITFKRDSLFKLCYSKVRDICQEPEKIKKLQIPYHIKNDMIKDCNKKIERKTRSGRVYNSYII